MSIERQFTVAELWELGIRGDQYPDDWVTEDLGGAVVDVRSAGRHGLYDADEVVFRVDGALWRIRFESAPEDWRDNGLMMPPADRAKRSVTAIRVAQRVIRKTVYEPVTDDDRPVEHDDAGPRDGEGEEE